MKFLPIEKVDHLNQAFIHNPECMEMITVFQELYSKRGFEKPWIGYFAYSDSNEIIGIAGFKGKPKNGKVEISYGTFHGSRQQGLGTKLCQQLVVLCHQHDKKLIIIARTLPENNASTKILRKNGFEFAGPVWDEDEGDVWEWEYKLTVHPNYFKLW